MTNCVVIKCTEGGIWTDTAKVADSVSIGSSVSLVAYDNGGNDKGLRFKQGNFISAQVDNSGFWTFDSVVDFTNGWNIPASTYGDAQYLGAFEGHNNWQVNIDAEGTIKATNLQGNLTSTTATVGTLNVTTEAKIDKLKSRSNKYITTYAGLNRNYSDVVLEWTSYGSHMLPSSIPENARLKIYMEWAWSDSSSVAISDYIHLVAAAGRSTGDCIAIQNCGPQGPNFTFSSMHQGGDAATIADQCGPIYVVSQDPEDLIDVIPPFATHKFMWNGTAWVPIDV